ncbi:MAG: RNA 2',3'-cyclic phosphodiesterase [Thermoplasmata archaeon]
MRVFLAITIDPTEEIKKAIKKISELPIKQSIVKENALHLTIKFFGEKNEDEINVINTTCLKLFSGIKPFKLKIKGMGIFGTYEFPRVIWMGIFPNTELNEIINRSNILFGKEDRESNPHLTISRPKQPVKRKELIERIIESYKDTIFWEGEIRYCTLKKSILNPSGAEYIDLFQYALNEPIN